MSSKINIISIIKGHLSTLIDASTSKYSKIDFGTFYIAPMFAAILGIYVGLDFSKDATNLLVTAGAIFTGLLLNLLILVYDQKSKLPNVDASNENWKEVQVRHTTLKELYYNISYSTLLSLIMVFISILHLFIVDKSVNIDIKFCTITDVSVVTTSPIMVFLGINLLLTIVMIIKRIYALLSSET